MRLGGGEFIRIGVAGFRRALLRLFRASEQSHGRKSTGSLRINKSVPIFVIFVHAQRIIGITDAGDEGLIALAACQAYIRETLR